MGKKRSHKHSQQKRNQNKTPKKYKNTDSTYIIITDKVNNKYHGYGMKNTYINVEFHNIQNSKSIET